MKLSIVIPLYNEEKRIEKTLRAYHQYFKIDHPLYDTEFVLSLNGCTDGTRLLVEKLQKELGDSVHIIETMRAGKGGAIINGFSFALQVPNDLIGFVDADMATQPEYFMQLVQCIHAADGSIGSRYMPGSQIYPERPLIKRWGSRFIFEPLVRLLFGINYYDFQCGAKVFKRHVISRVISLLTVQQWAFDVELLYLCKKFNFDIIEHPTVWYDQADSKLKLGSGFKMLSTLIGVWYRHFSLKNLLFR